MKIDRCLEILELEPGASPDDMKRAYKDLVNVWHPDRFAGNPRLMRRAERKLKEINAAYETLTRDGMKTVSGGSGRPSGGTGDRKNETEAFAEAGTELVLTACYHVYSVLRRWVAGGEA